MYTFIPAHVFKLHFEAGEAKSSVTEKIHVLQLAIKFGRELFQATTVIKFELSKSA